MSEQTYFAADYRERRLRTPELGFWIWYVEVALSQAGMLSRGMPMTEKGSRDIRRLRWQLIHDVRHLRAWVASSELCGFSWVASVFEAMLGTEAFDRAGFVAEIEKRLGFCDWLVEGLTAEVVRNAARRPSPMQKARLRRDHARKARVLRRARNACEEALAAKREWARRKAMAQAARAYTPTRQLLLPLPGLFDLGQDMRGYRSGPHRAEGTRRNGRRIEPTRGEQRVSQAHHGSDGAETMTRDELIKRLRAMPKGTRVAWSATSAIARCA